MIFLTDIIGDGSEANPYRSAMDDYGVFFTWLCENRVDSSLPGGKVIIRCASDPSGGGDPRIVPVTHGLLEANQIPDDGETDEDLLTFKVVRRFYLRQLLKLDDLPDLTLTIGDIPTAKRQRITTFLNNRNIDLSGITLSTTIANALRIILPQIKVQIHPSPAAPPSGTFTDNFTDTDTTALESHTPSGGTAWTRVDGAAGAITILSNIARCSNATNTAYTCDDQGSPNQYVQADYFNNSNSFSCNRLTDSNNWIGTRINGSKVQNFKRVTGTFTQLGSNGTTTWTSGDTLKLTSNSSDAHETFLNGSLEVGPNTAAEHNTVSTQGLVCRDGAISVWDNFEAGLLAAAAGSVGRGLLDSLKLGRARLVP